MKQRLKLLTLLTFISAVFLFSAYSTSKQVIDGVVQELLWRYAQVSAQHDAEKLLAPVIKEVSLVDQLASHPHITSWGMNSNDDVYRAVAEETLDKYRWQLSAKNFFVVLDENLAMHYNDVESIRKETFFRYYLDPQSRKDWWYFNQRDKQYDLRVNIATDAHLKLTKLWINKSIVKDGKFLGVLGTGISTKLLFEQFAQQRSHAVKTLFIDESNRIQFSVEKNQFHYPLTSKKNLKPTLKEYIANIEDYSALTNLMQRQKSGEEAEILLVQQAEDTAVVAIHYIEALGWYELTFVSIDAMVPKWVSTALYIPLIGMVLFCGLITYLYMVNHWIAPNERMNSRLIAMTQHQTKHGNLNEMVDLLERELKSARAGLEALVVSRTEQIDKMAIFDVDTGLHNRKGLKRELRAELSRSSRERHQFGLIWIDAGLSSVCGASVDSEVHRWALKALAVSLTKAIREYDIAARWGGDEFLLLVRTDSNDTLLQIACRIKQYLEQEQDDSCATIELSEALSIGGTLIKPNMSMQEALALADSSLYMAKSNENSTIYIHDISDAA